MLQAALGAGLTEVKQPGSPVLLHDFQRPDVHHRPSELNGAWPVWGAISSAAHAGRWRSGVARGCGCRRPGKH